MSAPSSGAPADVRGESEGLPAPSGPPDAQDLDQQDPIPAWASELRDTCLGLSRDVRELNASVALLLPNARMESRPNEEGGCTCGRGRGDGLFETSVLEHLEARRLSDQRMQASAAQLSEWLDGLKRDIQWSFRVVDVAHGDFKGEMTDMAEHVLGMAADVSQQKQSIADLREMTASLSCAVREIRDKADDNAAQLQRLGSLEGLLIRISEATRPQVQEPAAVPVQAPGPGPVPVEDRAVRDVGRAQKRLGLKKKRQAGQRKPAEDQDSTGGLGAETTLPLEGAQQTTLEQPNGDVGSCSAPCPKRLAGQKGSKDAGNRRGSRRPAAGKQPASAGDASPSPERVLRSAKKREARFKWQK
ncbi:hypothetical protein ESCO_003967 [Escovopsis weberi]|uniref:Uncharacterized protein n=1 Tax=Escovopsis weberi TaxID=150374 RepID=A0A0M8N4T1_ESCWE|nr:hypothetical protein ESCO_003967 [Escovopsis weberi]